MRSFLTYLLGLGCCYWLWAFSLLIFSSDGSTQDILLLCWKLNVNTISWRFGKRCSDYFTKPFFSRLLSPRSKPSSEDVTSNITADWLVLCLHLRPGCPVSRDHPFSLWPNRVPLRSFFNAHCWRVISRRQLFGPVWGEINSNSRRKHDPVVAVNRITIFVLGIRANKPSMWAIRLVSSKGILLQDIMPSSREGAEMSL